MSFAHEDGRILRSTLLFDSKAQSFSTLPDGATLSADLYLGFLENCIVDTPSQMMVASRVFEAVGVFSECRCDDYEFFIRASAERGAVEAATDQVRQHAPTCPFRRQFFRRNRTSTSGSAIFDVSQRRSAHRSGGSRAN